MISHSKAEWFKWKSVICVETIKELCDDLRNERRGKERKGKTRRKKLYGRKTFQCLRIPRVHTHTAAYKCGHFPQVLLKVIDAEVIMDDEGFNQQSGATQVKIRTVY